MWFLAAIGIIAAIYTLIKLSIGRGLKLQFLSENSWKIIFVFFIFARLSSVLANFQSYFYEITPNALLKTLYIWDKGLNFWGGLIAALVYFFYICKKQEQDFFKWLDVIVPSLLVGVTFGNLGAFFEGTNYGHETNLPWGVNFESPLIKYTVPIHPTQIYSFLYTGALAAIMIAANRTKKLFKGGKTGLIGLTALGSYGIMRFLEEFLRGDDVITILDIRLPFILAGLLTTISFVFLYLRQYNPKKSKRSKKT